MPTPTKPDPLAYLEETIKTRITQVLSGKLEHADYKANCMAINDVGSPGTELEFAL